MSSTHPNAFRGLSSPQQFKDHCDDGADAVEMGHAEKGKRAAKAELQTLRAKRMFTKREKEADTAE